MAFPGAGPFPSTFPGLNQAVQDFRRNSSQWRDPSTGRFARRPSSQHFPASVLQPKLLKQELKYNNPKYRTPTMPKYNKKAYKNGKSKNLNAIVKKHSHQLRKLGTPETKFHDVSLPQVEASYDMPTTGAQLAINEITQGANHDERIGDQIRMKTLSMRLSCQSGSDTDAIIRILIVCFKKGNVTFGNKVAPQIKDVLEAANSASDVYAFKKTDTYFVTKILFDKTIFLPANRITASAIEGGSGAAHREFQTVIKLSKMKGMTHAQYEQTGTDLTQNYLFFMATSNLAASANGPTVTGNFRLTYWDN